MSESEHLVAVASVELVRKGYEPGEGRVKDGKQGILNSHGPMLASSSNH